MIYLLVGLGNPGKKYQWNRHNIGMKVLEALAEDFKLSWSSKFKGEFAQFQWKGHKVFLLRPMTYMNLSGESVRACCDFYKLNRENIVVVYDEIDFVLGRIAFRSKGSSGGHNGLRSIESHLGGQDYKRLRLGVGRPLFGSVSSWVLSDFQAQDSQLIVDMIDWAQEGLLYLVEQNSLEAAAGKYNKNLNQTLEQKEDS